MDDVRGIRGGEWKAANITERVRFLSIDSAAKKEEYYSRFPFRRANSSEVRSKHIPVRSTTLN